MELYTYPQIFEYLLSDLSKFYIQKLIWLKNKIFKYSLKILSTKYSTIKYLNFNSLLFD